MSRPRLLLPQTLSKRKSYCNSTIYVWPWKSIKSLVASTFSFWVQNQGKIWWLKKVQYLKKKYHCKWTPLRGEKPKSFFFLFIILATCYNHLSSCQPLVSMCFQRNGKSEQFLETVYPGAKVISLRAPQH